MIVATLVTVVILLAVLVLLLLCDFMLSRCFDLAIRFLRSLEYCLHGTLCISSACYRHPLDLQTALDQEVGTCDRYRAFFKAGTDNLWTARFRSRLLCAGGWGDPLPDGRGCQGVAVGFGFGLRVRFLTGAVAVWVPLRGADLDPLPCGRGCHCVGGYSLWSRTAIKASCGIWTEPTVFMRCLPFFCFSRSFRFLVTSPP